MSELNITKGIWEYNGGDNNSIDIVLPDNTTISVDRQCRYSGDFVLSREGMEANAQLIAVAGTTANKCGKLPSELLQQRNELLEALKECYKGLNGFSAESLFDKIEELIKKI